MRLETTYELAKERHPEQVEEIIATLRRSKSKQKNANPEDLNWYYDYCKAVKAHSFMEVIENARTRAQEPPSNPCVEARVASMVEGLHFRLSASRKHWIGTAQLNEGFVPPELIAQFVERAEEERAEQERIDNLTPEERDAEVQELLGELRQDPGFMEFEIRA